jgi:PTH2 family peptidyl-tRNA hydrolase
MSEVKQVIVLRRKYPDGKGGYFSPRTGKLIAQACHASLKVLLDRMAVNQYHYGHSTRTEWVLGADWGTPMHDWLTNSFTKIVLYVESEDAITALANRCHFMKVPCAVITDAGRTEFHGEPTVTCIAIGPDYSEKIDDITGGLPLL